MEAWQRTPDGLHGELWRTFTALLVQDGGVVGTLSNLAFLLILGVLAEQVVVRWPRRLRLLPWRCWRQRTSTAPHLPQAPVIAALAVRTTWPIHGTDVGIAPPYVAFEHRSGCDVDRQENL